MSQSCHYLFLWIPNSSYRSLPDLGVASGGILGSAERAAGSILGSSALGTGRQEIGFGIGSTVPGQEGV